MSNEKSDQEDSDDQRRQRAYFEVIERDRDETMIANAINSGIAFGLVSAVGWALYLFLYSGNEKYYIFVVSEFIALIAGFLFGRSIYLYEDDIVGRTLIGYEFFAFVSFATLCLVGAGIALVYLIALSASSPLSVRLIISFIIIPSAALSLFALRKYRRIMYGLTEICAGLLIPAYKIILENGSFSEPNLYIAILTAGVYLVVRGLDNVDIGRKERAEKRSNNGKIPPS
ncbi:hypothetical protein [Ottowia sp.]|uniref:hypothetical protein n=1 Tax=Ottowia sp. TaxID=1898956 RepID=UPI0039E52A78